MPKYKVIATDFTDTMKVFPLQIIIKRGRRVVGVGVSNMTWEAALSRALKEVRWRRHAAQEAGEPM